ncbi:glycosyl transferase [Pedobacter hiemivivus]|uniref:Glycosyl transferase n=1 Tax=Pedobacter hiemivivus TaxID=2530454 RepID=A0A4U1FZQ9_9SPHI|nr:glycosyl transferase [Pedobacter hiemivivus]TKC56558.1 glycosyl transferase [Pedobacter hiemivivus]
MKSINVYVINLKRRPERKSHSIKEYLRKDEFNLFIVEANENRIGAVGLWSTIKYIISELVPIDDEFIIISEDDHKFTEYYDKKMLFNLIDKAKELDADILLGGVSWFNTAVQISPQLFWADKFNGLQFTVVYRKFFNTILQTILEVDDPCDYLISELTENKLIIYPFVSTQKEFGYSDVTSKNSTKGYVEKIFNASSERLDCLVKIGSFYNMKY